MWVTKLKERLIVNFKPISTNIMKKLLFLAGILTLMASCCNTEKLSPVLSIEGGQVQGVSADRVKGVYVFRGIPYAAAPIRENRWKAPQPVEPWEGVKLCNRFDHPSYQHIQYKGGVFFIAPPPLLTHSRESSFNSLELKFFFCIFTHILFIFYITRNIYFLYCGIFFPVMHMS